MLHLKFALNLENIVDEIIDTISSHWTSPFNAPVVIFPDPKLEQWFRLRWIQKKGVLANLNKKTIDQFLFEILIGDNKNKKKLNADLLRNVMISYLTQKPAGSDKFNYQLLGDSVQSYLESYDEISKEAKLDENRLFDFTSTMAGLFLEYETSRPKGFFFDPETQTDAVGILDCWKQSGLKDFFITKNGQANEKEEWQRKLYSDLFHAKGDQSLLDSVFKTLGKKSGNEVTYLTLPFLFEDCKKNNEIQFNYEGNLPVFIIGLGGMGQFYRVILHEFAKSHDIFAFVQNPCMEFWEDYSAETFKPQLPSISTEADDESEPGLKGSENDLLRYWGKAGRDNIKLWSMACDYNTDFKDVQDQSAKNMATDSLLHQVQWAVANRQNQLPSAGNIQPDEQGNYFVNDSSLRLTSAPSKIREVEAMHSHVCKLLNGTATADGKPAKISDILVVSPNIDDYRTAIYQVFDQSKELSADTKTALHIPFSIVDSQASNSLVASALSTLFKLREKKILSRPDFFSLVRNPAVQLARGIDPTEVSSWEKWIAEMNIFRDKDGDWLHGVKRLLMGRFSSVSVTIGDTVIAPYEDFESGDNGSLYRFVNCVESLENWMSERQWGELIDEAQLDDIIEFLDSWLLIQNPPTGFGGESIIYQSVCEAKKDLKYFYAAGSRTITWKMISQMLMTAAQGSEYSCGNLFVNGLTFMKFTPNRTLPVKYLFILGMDAGSFPGINKTSTLDLRKSVRPWPGDDRPITKNRYAFLCQLMSTSEGFFASYVNKNLQKDEDFYPSSVMNDLRAFLKNSLPQETEQEHVWPAAKIKLSEDRSWGELFTQREMRNKMTLQKFHTSDFKKTNYSHLEVNKNEFPKQVNASKLKKFLEEPFQFIVSQSLYIDGDYQDQEKLEFEPIGTEFLTRYNMKISQFCIALGVPENGEIQTLEDFEKMIQSEGILPAEPFHQKEAEAILGGINIVSQTVEGEYPKENFNYSRKDFSANLLNTVTDNNGNSADIRWTISGTAKIFIEDKASKSATFIDFCVGGAKPKHYINSYINALIFRSNFESECPDTFIRIVSFGGDMTEPIAVTRTPAEAREILQELYQRAYIDKFQKVLPIDYIPENLDYWSYMHAMKNFDNMSHALKSSWMYFAGKNLFDIEKVCGYTYNTFAHDWAHDIQWQGSLFPELASILGLNHNEEAV